MPMTRIYSAFFTFSFFTSFQPRILRSKVIHIAQPPFEKGAALQPPISRSGKTIAVGGIRAIKMRAPVSAMAKVRPTFETSS